MIHTFWSRAVRRAAPLSRPILPLFLLGLTLLGPALLGGCAARRAAPATLAAPAQLSREARIQYYYLVYQDQILRLQRLTRTQAMTPQNVSRALDYQKTAVEALDQLLELAPSADLYLDKANLYWNNEQISTAREILSAGLARFPDDRELNLYLANAWLMEGKQDQSAQVFGAYIARFPKDFQAREQFAQVLVDMREYARALDVLKPLPREKMDSETLYVSAQAESGLGQHRQAIRTLGKVLDKDPEFFDAMALLAYQYEMLKDYASAEKAYAKLLAADDSRDEVRLRLITLELKLNNPDKALGLVQAGPQTKSFLLGATETFLREGFADQASSVLDMLAQQAPLSSEYYFYKAMIAYEGQNDPAAALKFLARVPEGDPHYAQALQFRVQLLNVQGRREEALNAAREGLRLFPTQSRFYVLVAGILAEAKDLDGAMKVMNEGVAKLPDDADLLYRLGLLKREMGDDAGALETMEQVIRKNPDHADALNYVGYTLADERRDLDRALVLVQSALRQEPENGYMLDSLAWVYYRMGKLPEAWNQIRRAVTLEPEDPELWHHYGDIAKALGKTAEARNGYKKALRFKAKQPRDIQQKLESL